MTDVMNGLVRGLVDTLNLILAGEPTRAMAQYPAQVRQSPLKKPVIAVGLQDVATLPSSLADFAGMDSNGNHVYGRTLEATVAMTICCPPDDTAAECLHLLELVAGGLLLGQQEYEVLRVWCGKVSFDKELGALTLPCFAKTHLTVGVNHSETDLKEFVIRRAAT